jgi:hypothetical protein
MTGPHDVLAGWWATLTGRDDGLAPDAVTIAGDPDPALPSVLRVGTLAGAAVGTATLAAAVFGAERVAGPGAAPAPVRVDVRAAVASFRSERYLRLDGRSGTFWDPLSGDYRAADGWVRLHANFAHHADAACRALGVPADRDRLAAAVRERPAVQVEQAVIDAGGSAGRWPGCGCST